MIARNNTVKHTEDKFIRNYFLILFLQELYFFLYETLKTIYVFVD